MGKNILLSGLLVLAVGALQAQSSLKLKATQVLHPTCSDSQDGRITVQVKGSGALEVQAACGHSHAIASVDERGLAVLEGLGEGRCTVIVLGPKGEYVKLEPAIELKAQSVCFTNTNQLWLFWDLPSDAR